MCYFLLHFDKLSFDQLVLNWLTGFFVMGYLMVMRRIARFSQHYVEETDMFSNRHGRGGFESLLFCGTLWQVDDGSMIKNSCYALFDVFEFSLDFGRFCDTLTIVICLNTKCTLSPNSTIGNGGSLNWGES